MGLTLPNTYVRQSFETPRGGPGQTLLKRRFSLGRGREPEWACLNGFVVGARCLP